MTARHRRPNPSAPSGIPSLRKRFPFALGTTSFIFPEDWIGNARKLAPIVDEIEILAFESDPERGLPDATTVEALIQIGQANDVSYNVHLPTDVHIASHEKATSAFAVDRIVAAIRRTEALNPRSWTLHIEGPDSHYPVETWIEDAADGLCRLSKAGIRLERISLETLDYPPEHLMPLVDRFRTGICLDVGHLFCHGYDVLEFFIRYRDQIDLLHIHGVQRGKDHLSLDYLNDSQTAALMSILGQFTGCVSIEVFRLDDLVRSLDWLETSANIFKQPLSSDKIQIFGGQQ